MLNNQQRKQSQGGNVLFLILIAVALFAALSYVVTQSTRSGSGSTDREKSILSSAQMTQYPTALRTSLIRMVLAGVAVENIRFDAPATSGPFTTLSSSQLVFHPQGGGATYQEAPADLSASGNSALSWHYNADFSIPGIGTDGTGGNDVIAFLPGISASVCRQVNEKLNVRCTTVAGTVPKVTQDDDDLDVDVTEAGGHTVPTSGASIDPSNCAGALNRQASACFEDSTSPTARYVFYSVLLER